MGRTMGGIRVRTKFLLSMVVVIGGTYVPTLLWCGTPASRVRLESSRPAEFRCPHSTIFRNKGKFARALGSAAWPTCDFAGADDHPHPAKPSRTRRGVCGKLVGQRLALLARLSSGR